MFKKAPSILIILMSTLFIAAAMCQPANARQNKCQGEPKDSLCSINTLCENASAAYCLVHIDNRFWDNLDDPVMGGLMEKCIADRVAHCTGTLDPNKPHTSTNPTDLPKPWDCNVTDASWGLPMGRASDTTCRMVNYCSDISAQVCADDGKANKYTEAGQEILKVCNAEFQQSCLEVFQD